MFIYFYSRPLWAVWAVMLIGLAIWTILCIHTPKKIWHTVNLPLAVVLVLFILYATVFNRTNGETELILMPFAAFSAAKQQPELYREMLMNVFLFFPMGLTLSNALPCRWRISVRIGVTVLVGCVLSVGIEFIQYRFSLGTAETDDVICNTLGTFIGSLSLLTALACEKLKEKLGI